MKGQQFNCDNKFSKGHKCGENKLFYIECEEEEEKEQEPPQGDELELITPTISCHALWLDVTLLKLSRLKDISKIKR